MLEGNLFVSPSFVKAENAEKLKAEMLKINIAHAMSIKFFDIQFAQNDWYAWYYIDQEKQLREKVNNATNKPTRSRTSKLYAK